MTDYERTTVRETTAETDPVVARPAHDRDHVVTRESSYRAGTTGGEMIRRFVILLFGILQGLLILRIILLLLVANPGNDVVSMIMGITDPFIDPFRGMFQLERVAADQGSVLDIAAIVALIGWTLVEALVIAALSLGARRGEDATA